MTDWFRSWHGAPTDPKWLAVAKRAKVAPGVVSAVAWALCDCASQAEQRGSIEKFSSEIYSSFSGFRIAVIDRVLAAMREIGFIDGNRLSAWEKRQPKREDGSAERAREWRERNRTQANAPERPEQSREDIEKNREDKRESASPAAPPAAKRATRLAIETLPDDWRAFCKQERPDLDADRTFANFKDHFTASSGRNAAKLDWMAAWRLWVRREKPPARAGPLFAAPETDFDRRLKAEIAEKKAANAG